METRGRGAFLMRALHSLFGIVPLGAFMLAELWMHAKALAGPAAHRQALALFGVGRWSAAAIALVLIPVLYHALYGLWLAFRPRYTVRRYPTNRNWMYTLVRVTGVLSLGFLVFHVGLTRPELLGLGPAIPPAQLHDALTASLSATTSGIPLTALLYLIGLGICIFHLMGGLWNMATRWGLTPGRSGQRRLGYFLVVVGLGVLAFAGHGVVYLATGVRFMGPGPEPPTETGRCVVEKDT